GRRRGRLRRAHGGGDLVRARVRPPRRRRHFVRAGDRRLELRWLRARRRARSARPEAPPPGPCRAPLLRAAPARLVPRRGGEPACPGDRARLVQRGRRVGPARRPRRGRRTAPPPAALTARPTLCYRGRGGGGAMAAERVKK